MGFETLGDTNEPIKINLDEGDNVDIKKEMELTGEVFNNLQGGDSEESKLFTQEIPLSEFSDGNLKEELATKRDEEQTGNDEERTKAKARADAIEDEIIKRAGAGK